MGRDRRLIARMAGVSFGRHANQGFLRGSRLVKREARALAIRWKRDRTISLRGGERSRDAESPARSSPTSRPTHLDQLPFSTISTRANSNSPADAVSM